MGSGMAEINIVVMAVKAFINIPQRLLSNNYLIPFGIFKENRPTGATHRRMGL
jgi:hypothetical protein